MRPHCQYGSCDAPAERGAYTWKIVPVPAKQPRFCFALFCPEHGKQALLKGARHIHWRPQPGGAPSLAVLFRARLEGDPLSPQLRRVFSGARAELVRQGVRKPGYADIMSEAIEAAEALGI